MPLHLLSKYTLCCFTVVSVKHYDEDVWLYILLPGTATDGRSLTAELHAVTLTSGLTAWKNPYAIKAANSGVMSIEHVLSCKLPDGEQLDDNHKLNSTWHVCKGDWLCPSCVGGERHRPRKGQSATAREHLLAGGKKLALVQIQALWKEPDGSQCFTGRWYEIPESTHTGRQVNRLLCAPRAGRNQLWQHITALLLHVLCRSNTVA